MTGIFDKDKLTAASFNGVEFKMDNVSTSGGQKTVVHEYPNSNTRVVENLGDLPDSYIVKAIIDGSDYFDRKKALRDAIKKPGVFVFNHPYDGKVNCSVDGAYNYNETDKSLGETVITFKLFVASNIVLPTILQRIITAIIDGVATVYNTLKDGLIAGWDAVSDPENFTQAVALIEDSATFISDQAKVFVQNNEVLSSFAETVSNFFSNSTEDASDPSKLADDSTQSMQEAAALSTTPEERFESMKGFFGFGDDEEPVNVEVV